MKITKATIRETSQTFSTKLLAEDKGHDLTYEAGVLCVRSQEHPGKVFMYPLSNIVVMEAEDTTAKKK